jgi:transcription elongation factor Elf1
VRRDVVFVRPAAGRLVVECQVCGAQVDVMLPATVDTVAAVCEALVEAHRPCESRADEARP